MARRAFAVTLRQSLGEGQYTLQSGAGADPLLTAPVAVAVSSVATLVADEAPVAAAVAVLVADGASPTQAHVTTLNAAYASLAVDVADVNTQVTAVDTARAAATKDVVVSFDTTNVANLNQLKAALDAVLRQAAASGMV
jgi:hypothetical protein